MFQLLTYPKHKLHTVTRMQLSVKRNAKLPTRAPSNLSELKTGEQAVIDRLDLPEEIAKRLWKWVFSPDIPSSRPSALPAASRVSIRGRFGDRTSAVRPPGGCSCVPRKWNGSHSVLRLRIPSWKSHERLPGVRWLSVASDPPHNGALLRIPKSSPSLALPIPAKPRFSIASPACARKSPISPASPSSSKSAARRLDRWPREYSSIDLPGVYSLIARSEDEQVAHDVLTGQRADTPKPEAVLLVLDSTNLGRHLMLAAPILALGLPTLVILNMADDLRKPRRPAGSRGACRRELGAPVALVSARQGEGSREGITIFWPARLRQAARPRNCRSSRTFPSAARGPGSVGSQAALPRARSAQVDAPPGCRFLHPGGRAADLSGGGGRGLSDHLQRRRARRWTAIGWFSISGNWIAHLLPASSSARCCSKACGEAWAR